MSEILEKTCTYCGETLPATSVYFYKSKRGKYGLSAYCKCCELDIKHKRIPRKSDIPLSVFDGSWMPPILDNALWQAVINGTRNNRNAATPSCANGLPILDNKMWSKICSR
ncbi:hypothetical protein [Neisseria dentiae]|uniref:hypothetical protein n=1 Tax=Neisseria dentiae TaxID=194197 RepID=UPI001359E204|nr:hypothetical protein [Neisseria dentiae]